MSAGARIVRLLPRSVRTWLFYKALRRRHRAARRRAGAGASGAQVWKSAFSGDGVRELMVKYNL